MKYFSFIRRKNVVAVAVLILTVSIIIIGIVSIKSDDQANNNSSVADDGSTLEMEIIGYMYGIQYFTELNVEQIEDMLKQRQTFILYTGRLTCEWCRRLVPVLSTAVRDNDVDIYYLDSENTDTDVDIKKFRDTYSIPTVPSIIFFDSNGNAHHIESNISDESFNEDDFLREVVSYYEEVK